jgi:hypothetical protein
MEKTLMIMGIASSLRRAEYKRGALRARTLTKGAVPILGDGIPHPRNCFYVCHVRLPANFAGLASAIVQQVKRDTHNAVIAVRTTW